MTDQIHKILKQYWGYSSFRPLQEDIIQAALAGQDTLALMPTGGGKSICFQVPVMAREGIGIIVSPLISLMNDQVQNLKKLNIPALAITSGLSYREIDLGLDNCVHGRYKFLYLSPERLQTEIVRERLKKMKVNLMVVDEAHCISQWGYDFRPAYVRIAEAREWLKEIPVLALTATATKKVVEDIQEKLLFNKKNVIQQSFYRPNLYYNVNHTEKKWSQTLEILQRIKGSGIIYVRNRKHTVEVSQWLNKNDISSDYYHAGLDTEARKYKQQQWLKNSTRIIVCTNAFGMGIDKPDVRIVLHLDLPDSLEAYFQEAGRGGRDGQLSYSVVLVGPADVEELKKRYLETFPDLEFMRRVYQALGNYLQLATGAGEGQSFDFDFGGFIKQYSLGALKTYAAIKILEKEGLLILNEGFRQPSKVLILLNRTELYDFQLRSPKLDVFLKILFRSYGGLDVEYTTIDESQLSQRLKTSPETVHKTLLHLKKHGVLDYIPRKGDSEIIITQARQTTGYLSISDENLKDRYADRKKRIHAVEDFLMDNKTCRSIKLLHYFGEKSNRQCGHCDVCRQQNLHGTEEALLLQAITNIRNLFKREDKLSLKQIKASLKLNEHLVTKALRWLLDNGELELQKHHYLRN